MSATRERGRNGKRTNHALLFSYDLTEIFKDLIQFCDTLFDLFNLSFSFLNQLFLEFEVCILDLIRGGLPVRTQTNSSAEDMTGDEMKHLQFKQLASSG